MQTLTIECDDEHSIRVLPFPGILIRTARTSLTSQASPYRPIIRIFLNTFVLCYNHLMFRKITEKDREFYIEAAKSFYSSDAVDHQIPESFITRTFDELIKSDRYADAYIIEQDGQKAGYALLAKTFSQEAGGLVVWLEELFILPEFRSCGLGGEFLRFLKENIPSARLRLELCPSNQRACDVYMRHGFKVLDYKQMIYDKI